MIDVTPIKNPDVPHIMDLLFFVISCNGLILLSNTVDGEKIMVILNPLTKECRKLPKHDAVGLGFGSGFCYGFGYDSDDYKVVRIHKLLSGGKDVYQTHIYSLKLDSWRKVEDCPCNIGCNGVSLDGVVYWESQLTITALDLRTERYCQLPQPLGIRGFVSLRLDALDGCLICTLNNHEKKTLDAWVMKDNGWSKLFSLKISFLYPFLVAYLKRKGQILLHNSHGFLWFDIQNNLIKSFTVHGFLDFSSSRICPGNLVRLNGSDSDTGLGIVGSNNITKVEEMKMKTKRKETRLKFCVRNVGDMCCSDYINCTRNSCLCCKEE